MKFMGLFQIKLPMPNLQKPLLPIVVVLIQVCCSSMITTLMRATMINKIGQTCKALASPSQLNAL